VAAGSAAVSPDATQFDAALAAIAAARPSVVLDSLVGAEAIAYHKQFAADPRTRAITRASLQMQEAEATTIGPGPADVYIATDYLAADPAGPNQDWIAALTTKYGDSAIATATGAEAYDAVELLAMSISRAGSANGPALITTLTTVSFTGPRGAVSIKPGSHGYASLATHIGRLNKGRGIDQVEVGAPLDPAVACAS
jgi:branched-chain amino acid transport system substrate-binding protein